MQCHHLHKGINTGDDVATSCKDLVSFGAVTPEIMFLIYVPLSLCVVIWQKSVYNLHLSRWHFQMHWTIEISMGAFQAAMDMYISYKFGGLLSGTSAVNAAQLCTADINQHSS